MEDSKHLSGGKYLLQLAILTIVDYLVIRFWILRIDPDPSVSIGLMFLLPAVFAINIVIAIILAVFKKRYAGLFSLNSVIASILMYVLFMQGIDRHQNIRYESWKFNLHDTAFEITLSKLDTTFYLSYSASPGSSIVFLNGKYQTIDKKIILKTDTSQFFITDGILYDFTKNDKIIKLAKLKR